MKRHTHRPIQIALVLAFMLHGKILSNATKQARQTDPFEAAPETLVQDRGSFSQLLLAD